MIMFCIRIISEMGINVQYVGIDRHRPVKSMDDAYHYNTYAEAKTDMVSRRQQFPFASLDVVPARRR